MKVKGYSDVLPGLVAEHSRREVPEVEEEEEGFSWKKLPKIYLNLSKSRLTSVSVGIDLVHLMTSWPHPLTPCPSVLVVVTAMGGYSMAPAPLDPAVLLWTAAGTALCSGAANTFNQVSKELHGGGGGVGWLVPGVLLSLLLKKGNGLIVTNF